ncbi:hypothetical protein ACPA54_22580 [Uniformispora flossi]|uniref:hypothetical protein n=1 Tax=Uniformispora flossi TaxID=3390723 RepID=UPI003C2FBB47
MSPVSRKRKAKSGAKKATGAPTMRRQGADDIRSLRTLFGGESEPPTWWAASFRRVLDGAAILVAAPGPLALENAGVDLLGAAMCDALHTEQDGFDWRQWLAELVGAAEARAAEPGVRRLLHVVEGTADAAERKRVRRILGDTRRTIPTDGDGAPWLRTVPAAAPTGEVAMLTDVYGSRMGLLVECAYPAPDAAGKPKGPLTADRHVLLVDVDTCAAVAMVVDAAVFADMADAAAHWRRVVGPAAAQAAPEPAPAEIVAELWYEAGQAETWSGAFGGETPEVVANTFRVRRRIADLRPALAKRGVALRPLDHAARWEPPVDELLDAFLDWRDRSGRAAFSARESEAAAGLIHDWTEGGLPTVHLTASPHRVATARERIGQDWARGPERDTALTLLPEWTEYVLAQAGTPPEFATPALAVARGGVYPHLDDTGRVPFSEPVVE